MVMKSVLPILLSVAIVSVLVTTALSNPLDTFVKGCEKELSTYCADVTPGDGRVLACLYSHQDKVSAQCEYAIYDAAVQLERAVAALTYVASSCDDDLDTYCAGVPAGDGRLADCLNRNKEKISTECKQAMQDVGL